jgi:hypothetical protein
MSNPIELVQNKDKTWTLFYFGKEAGYIQRSYLGLRGQRIYRGLSVHGSIVYGESLNTVKSDLLGLYH